MARIFITGSADGLGQLTAIRLVKQGHKVVLHARNEERARQAMEKVPGAEMALSGDLSSMAETKMLAAMANETGRFDAVIHNAGIYNVPTGELSRDGISLLFAVNSLAPYILTSLMQKPERLIYLSSGMHLQGKAVPEKSDATEFKQATITYSDTKLHNVMLAMIVHRKRPDIIANAVNPGWVPTKMGGAGAPDNLEKGFETQVWLAVSNDPAAKPGGRYLFHQKESRFLPIAADIHAQEIFLSLCEEISGVRL